MRDYQHDFSLNTASMYDADGRERKARTMLAVLRDHWGDALAGLDVLNVGASTGIIDAYLARHVRQVTGIDIDRQAIDFASRQHQADNLRFLVGDAMALPAGNDSVDIVVCAQVYEHVPDAERMMAEIRRVLRPGGTCYFAANNRLIMKEPHHRLWFLSWLPPRLADAYLRLAGKGSHYYERHRTLGGLHRLVAGFEVIDYTPRIVQAPVEFHAEYMLPARGWKARAVRGLFHTAPWLFPGYIWLLRKPSRG